MIEQGVCPMRKVSAAFAVLAILVAGVGTYVFDFFSAFASMGQGC